MLWTHQQNKTPVRRHDTCYTCHPYPFHLLMFSDLGGNATKPWCTKRWQTPCSMRNVGTLMVHWSKRLHNDTIWNFKALHVFGSQWWMFQWTKTKNPNTFWSDGHPLLTLRHTGGCWNACYLLRVSTFLKNQPISDGKAPCDPNRRVLASIPLYCKHLQDSAYKHVYVYNNYSVMPYDPAWPDRTG